jgi:hypothetical protein
VICLCVELVHEATRHSDIGYDSIGEILISLRQGSARHKAFTDTERHKKTQVYICVSSRSRYLKFDNYQRHRETPALLNVRTPESGKAEGNSVSLHAMIVPG